MTDEERKEAYRAALDSYAGSMHELVDCLLDCMADRESDDPADVNKLTSLRKLLAENEIDHD